MKGPARGEDFPLAAAEPGGGVLGRAYRVRDSPWAPRGGRPWWVPAGVFLFRVRYLSDAREEDLLEVAVTLTDGRLLRRLGGGLDRHRLGAGPLGGGAR